jgi:hypothetical protein
MPPPSRRALVPVTLSLALALGAGQLTLAAGGSRPANASGALNLALALLLAGAALLAVVAVCRREDVRLGRPAPRPPAGALRALPVLVVTGALVALPLLGQPARLTLTLYSYLLLAGVTWWVVRRGAGPRAATGAVAGLAGLCLVAACAQRPSMRFIEDWRPDSPYKWAVGWPTDTWRLRHTVHFDAPGPRGALRVRLFLARPYDGPARVFATVNGQEVSVGRTESELHVDVPAALAAGASDLDLVLRQSPPDPRLRLLATRWAEGASRGPAASSFGDGLTWQPGTFNDTLGRRQPGVLTLHVEARE